VLVTYAATEHLGCGALGLLGDARPVGTRSDLSGRLIGGSSEKERGAGSALPPVGGQADVTEGSELACGCIEARAQLAVLGYFLLGRGGIRAAHTPARTLITLRHAVAGDTQPREATHGAAK
jgi:hypothetical protein